MVLAAIGFSDGWMLVGLLAAAVPVVLHLLNRMRSPVVAFPTLRFLRITAQKTARRRQIQQYLLLLVRMVVFALAALAVAAPLIHGGSAGLAYGFVGMILGGLLLVVLGVVAWSAAMKAAAVKSTAGVSQGNENKFSGAGYGGLAALCLIAALLLGGYAGVGLFSDRYFSGERGEFSGRMTAAAIILDNSHSMLVKEQGATRLARAKTAARAVLSEAVVPAVAALMPTNPPSGGGGMSGGLTGDMTRLLGNLDTLSVQGRAMAMRERVNAALAILGKAEQPSRMLIIASDFAEPAFADAEIFSELKDLPWRGDLQVVLMPMGSRGGESGQRAVPEDVGIMSWTVAKSSERPVVGAQVVFEAEVINNGAEATWRDFKILMDDHVMEGIRPHVQLGAAGSPSARMTISVPYRLTAAGPHRFEIAIDSAPDAMEWDDRRDLVLDVAGPVKALVVGAEEGGARNRSAAFYLMAALSPYGNGGGNGGVEWGVKPEYRGIAGVKDAGGLAGYAAVFMCDVPRVTAGQAEALAKYVRGGGRLIWVLGPSVDSKNYNEMLLGERTLLPSALGEPLVSAAGSALSWADMESGIFADLFDSQEPIRSAIITGRWDLGKLERGRAVAKLEDGSVVVAEHGLEKGEVFTVATSPGAAWSNLGATVLLVPMATRMALDSGAYGGMSDVRYTSGQSLFIRMDPPAAGGVSLDVTTPGKMVVNVRNSAAAGANGGGGTPQWFFEETGAAGIYTWKTSDGKRSGMFAVNPPGEEADLAAVDVEALARQIDADLGGGGGRPTIVAADAGELRGQLEHRGEGTSLLPGFIGMVLMLCVVEGLLANRRRE